MQRIPFQPEISADQLLRVALGGQYVSLRLTWNERVGYWYADLTFEDSTMTSIKLVPKWPLVYSRRGQTSFVGDLILLPRGATSAKPAYDELGVTWFLMYITPDELEAWRANNGLG